MAQTVCVLLSGLDRKRLAAIASDRNQPGKCIERARVILASVNRRPVQQVATERDVNRPMVWRWQRRFAEEGPEGLLRDKTRKPGKSPIVAEAVALTCGEAPAGATHWTDRRWPRLPASRCDRCNGSGRRISCSRTGCAASSARGIRGLPRRWPISSACISIHLPTRWCCRLMKRARSRHSTAPSRGCG
jgi:hypothetical protein